MGMAQEMQDAFDKKGIPAPGSAEKGAVSPLPLDPATVQRLYEVKREKAKLEREEKLLVQRVKDNLPAGTSRVGSYEVEITENQRKNIDWKGWVLYRTGQSQEEMEDSLARTPEYRQFINRKTVKTLSKVEMVADAK